MPIQRKSHSQPDPMQRLIDLIAHRIAKRLHEKNSTSKLSDSPDGKKTKLKNNDIRVIRE